MSDKCVCDEKLLDLQGQIAAMQVAIAVSTSSTDRARLAQFLDEEKLQEVLESALDPQVPIRPFGDGFVRALREIINAHDTVEIIFNPDH